MDPEARALYFVRPGTVELREEPLRPSPGQVRVRSRLMGISHGTELLAFRGQLPVGLEADAALKSLPGRLEYPLKYGYSNCGRVEEAGPSAGAQPGQRAGQRVFAFYPHQDLFDADPEELVALPPEVSDEQAVFLPNLETALGIVHDAGGAPWGTRAGGRLGGGGPAHLGPAPALRGGGADRRGAAGPAARAGRAAGLPRAVQRGAAAAASGSPSSRGAAARMRRSTAAARRPGCSWPWTPCASRARWWRPPGTDPGG